MSDFDAEFTIMDFLDYRGRMDSPFKDWVLSTWTRCRTGARTMTHTSSESQTAAGTAP